MLRIAFIAAFLITLMIACSDEQKRSSITTDKPAVPHIFENRNKLILNRLKSFQKPIALVLVGDTIFHCEKLTTDECGTNAECGQYQFNCLKDPKVEYLKTRSY